MINMEGILSWKNLIWCLLLPGICANAVASVGTITEQINSPASIQRQKTTVNGTKGTGVEMQDSIRTTAGKIGIKFQDNTRVQINENSKLIIDDFVYDPKQGTGKAAMKMAMGTVRYASGQIAKNNPQKISLNTPSATISVRGTDFTATVDELGKSTIILLPSCPDNIRELSSRNIDRDCKTGEISVESDVGIVILNQPFQATVVATRDTRPSRPVILNLNENAIDNMLILSPPPEFTDRSQQQKIEIKGALDVDFLKEMGLVNVLDEQQKEVFTDRLSRNFLDTDFLSNILDVINAMLAAQLDMLNKNNNSKLLPDWNPATGVIVELDEPHVTLCRDNGSDVQCVTTPTSQNTTIFQTQNNIEIKNRINTGGTTVITLIQK